MIKPANKLILILAIISFTVFACVSSPVPADTPPQAQSPALTAEPGPGEPAAEIAQQLEPEPPAEATAPAAASVTPASAPVSAPPVPDPAPDPAPAPQQPEAQQPEPQAAPSLPPATPAAKAESTPAPATSPATPPAAAPTKAEKPATPEAGTSQTATAGQVKPRQIGEIVYTEGEVSVHRAGKSISTLDIGDVVYAYDVVITGPDSLAQVDLGSGRPGGAFIRLSENTAFYFDTKELSEAQRRTVLQLLSGSIAVKVEKLAGGSFSAISETAVLGVRGTEFVIDTIPDGSILVSCIEGAVAIQDSGDQSAIAQPGKAVTSRGGELKTSNIPVSELAQFRSGWRQDSFAGFAPQAALYSSAYAAALDTKRGAFDSALADLRANADTLRAWRAAKDTGRTPRFTEWTTEKKRVGAALFESLKALFAIERPYYRLQELKSLHDRGTGVGTLSDGRDTAEFFSQFDAYYGSLADGMAEVREALLLFAWVSAGSPLGEFFGANAETLGSGAMFLDGDDW